MFETIINWLYTIDFNLDKHIIIFFNYIHSNPITFGALWGILKLMAMKSSTNTDDKILTWIGNKFGVKF